MYALDCMSEVNQQVLVKIAEKLPVYLQHRWRHQVSKLREKGVRPGIDDILNFIKPAAREVNDPVFGNLGTSGRSGSNTVSQTPSRKGFHGVINQSIN